MPLAVAAVAVAALVVPATSSPPAGSGFAGSLLAVAPADEVVTPPACRSTPHAVADEERLEGTTAWRPTPAPAPVVGYLDRTSARCGDRVGVHLSGRGPVDVRVYRVGWYGGRGARLVWTHPQVAVAPRAAPTVDRATRMPEVRWPTSTRIKVRPSWTPGVYLVVATPAGSQAAPGDGAVMPLVVEATEPARVLVVASTLTWASYNPFGGASTYGGTHGRALAASLDRPLVGGGLKHLLVYDLPLARFLGRARIQAEWTTDDQLDRFPGLPARHTAVVFPGHSEYWTARMYDGVEAARNRGTNVAFLGANPVYWQTRLTASPSGPRRRMLIYRDARRDPVAARTPELTTVRWRDAPLHRDQAQLVGTTFAVSGVHAGMQVVDAPAWLLAGTGLRKGRGLIDAAANEVDRLAPPPAAPPNLQVVLRGAYTTPSGKVGDFAATYYTVPAAGAVFAAGTTAWPCGLDRTCPFGPVPESTASALRQMTANLLRAFSTTGWAASNPSVPSDVLPLGAFWDQLPESLRGVGGVRENDGLNED